MTQGISASHYHPPIKKSEIKKADSLYDLSLDYSKYLNLFRLPFRIVSTTYSCLKNLPISKEFLGSIESNDEFIRTFNSTLNLPRFFINQIGFYKSCSDLNAELSHMAQGKPYDLASAVSNVFFSTLSLSLSSIKIWQLGDKLKLTNIGRISSKLPLILAKSTNIITLLLIGRGLVNSLFKLYEQAEKDYASKTWSVDGLSPGTIKTIVGVASKSLSFFYVSTTTASLYFGIYASPVLLVAVSASSLALNLINNMDTYKELIWGKERGSCNDYTAYLPA